MPDVGEVLLLYVGLVVLFVGAGAGPLGRASLAQEMVFDNGVEELTAVVAIKTEHFKRQPGFDKAEFTPEPLML